MKRKIFYLTILIFIFLLFQQYNLVLSTSVMAVDLWLHKVFPYLFIMIVINELLLQADFAYLFKKPHLYVFFMSILSGSPTSAYITKELYDDAIIDEKDANLTLIFTYFCNPLFMFSFFQLLFQNIFLTVKLIFIIYLSNTLLFCIYRKKMKKRTLIAHKIKLDLALAIKKAITTTTMVLGVIVFYMVVTNVFLESFSFLNRFALLIKGFLEVTQGLNALLLNDLSSTIKEVLALIFVSFGGLSIHTQILCILESTSLKYSYFLKGRILGTLLVLIMYMLLYSLG